MEFKAELKQVQARKLASGDIAYKVVLETNYVNVLDLGKLPSDSLFSVSVELVANNTKQGKESKENARSNRYAV